MNKTKFTTYNDGMLYICEGGKKDSDFNVIKNPKTKKDLTKEVKLAYKEMSQRDQDIEFAKSEGRMLSLKVKTRLYNDINRLKLVLIENTLYSIFKLDIDRQKQELYLYLEEMRTFK